MKPKTRRSLVAGAAICATLAFWPAIVLAQKITVKSATPNQGAQETIDLDVVIAGSGFGPGAQARFVLSGTDNPDGIRVKNTKYVSNTQLVATVDIDATASLALFDIKVSVSGRSGKGTDLFQVVEKGRQACTDGPTQYVSASVIPVSVVPEVGCGSGLPGTLDCAFGASGLAVPAASGPHTGWDAVVQPDGRVVVLARGTPPGANTGSAAYVLRFNANGALDATFDGDGIAYLQFTTATDDEYPVALALQADGRLIIAAQVPSGAKGKATSAVGIARLNANGSNDPSFGTGGVVRFGFEPSGSSAPTDVKIQADGRIIVAGTGAEKAAAARLLSTGAFDNSFDLDGRLLLDSGRADGQLYLRHIAFQQVDGTPRIVLSGNSVACDGAPDIAVVRLKPDGGLDTAFGPTGTGRTFLDFGAARYFGYMAGVDPAGRLVIAGLTELPSAALTARLLPDGLVDASYGSGGATLFKVNGIGTSIASLALDATGRALVTGVVWQTEPAVVGSFLLARFDAAGQLDATFGSDGVTLTDFTSGYQSARRVLTLPSGRIVVVGTTPLGIGLAGFVQ